MGDMRPLRGGGYHVETGDPDAVALLVLAAMAGAAAFALHLWLRPHPAVSLTTGIALLVLLYQLVRRLPPWLRFSLVAPAIGGPAAYLVYQAAGDWIWAVFTGVAVGGIAGANFLALGEENFVPPMTAEEFQRAVEEHERETRDTR